MVGRIGDKTPEVGDVVDGSYPMHKVLIKPILGWSYVTKITGAAGFEDQRPEAGGGLGTWPISLVDKDETSLPACRLSRGGTSNLLLRRIEAADVTTKTSISAHHVSYRAFTAHLKSVIHFIL